MIMALDLATSLGIATGRVGEKPRAASHRVAPPDTPLGEWLHRYRAWFNDQLSVVEPDLVYYEAPILTQGKTSIQTAEKLISIAGVTAMICYGRGISCHKADSGEACKVFTGTGRYGNREEKKRAVMETCRRLGIPVKNDDEADAVAAWHLAESKLRGAARLTTPLFARGKA